MQLLLGTSTEGGEKANWLLSVYYSFFNFLEIKHNAWKLENTPRATKTLALFIYLFFGRRWTMLAEGCLLNFSIYFVFTCKESCRTSVIGHWIVWSWWKWSQLSVTGLNFQTKEKREYVIVFETLQEVNLYLKAPTFVINCSKLTFFKQNIFYYYSSPS